VGDLNKLMIVTIAASLLKDRQRYRIHNGCLAMLPQPLSQKSSGSNLSLAANQDVSPCTEFIVNEVHAVTRSLALAEPTAADSI